MREDIKLIDLFERYLNRIFRTGLEMGGNRHGIREQYEFIQITP